MPEQILTQDAPDILPANITLTRFPDAQASTKENLTWSLDTFKNYIRNPPPHPTKADCLFIKLCTFGDTHSPNNCLRYDDNVYAVTGVECDYDGPGTDSDAPWLSIEDAAELYRQAGVEAYLYTSGSYTAERPKWRAVLPLTQAFINSTSAMRTYRKQMVARADAIIGNLFAPESYTLSQGFYIGQVQGIEYKSFILGGKCVDLLDDVVISKNSNATERKRVDVEQCIANIHRGTYHIDTRDLAAHYIAYGHSADDTIEAIQSYYNYSPIKDTCPKWHERYERIEKYVEDAFDKYGGAAKARKEAREPANQLAAAGVAGELVTRMDEQVAAKIETLGSYPVDDVTKPDEVAEVITGLKDIQDMNLVARQDSLYAFDGSGYHELGGKWLRTKATNILPKCYQLNQKGMPEKGSATVANANNVANCIMSALHSDYIDAQSPPFYVRGKVSPDQCDADQLIVFRNGSLNINNGEFYKPDPNLFALNVLPHDYEPGAGAPVRWLQFLDEVWPDDKSSHDLLQEIFGYLLSGDTKLQKLFMFIGATRGGKGIIGGVIKAMIGEQNMCGQTLDGLTGTFGMQSMLGKRVWIMADARVGKSTDQSIAVERLLSITGGDSIEVRRMYMPAATQTLCVRPIIMANMMPKLYETSGALVARLVTLEFTVSFKGREDFDLNKKLLAELSGIVNWSMDGLKRLRINGQFTESAATKEMKDDFEQLNNPLFGFVNSVIVADSNSSESKADVYLLWKSFRAENEIIPGGSKQQFGRLLKSAIPSLKDGKKKLGNDRVHAYKNIRIVRGVYIESMREFWEFMVEQMESVR